MDMRRASCDDSPRCSFCKKGQKKAGRLISSPSDSPPRAYICDECVTMCAAVIEDDQRESQEVEDGPSENFLHPLLTHPLASTLMEAIESWLHGESLGKDGAIELRNFRAIASQMERESPKLLAVEFTVTMALDRSDPQHQIDNLFARNRRYGRASLARRVNRAYSEEDVVFRDR